MAEKSYANFGSNWALFDLTSNLSFMGPVVE